MASKDIFPCYRDDQFLTIGKVTCSKPQKNGDPAEARARDPSARSPRLYHCTSLLHLWVLMSAFPILIICWEPSLWARKWGMRFQPVKCNMMQLAKKHNKIQASYMLEGTALEIVESINYLGVTITSDLKWNSYIMNVCSNANRTLGFLRRIFLFSCPQDVKEAVNKSLV